MTGKFITLEGGEGSGKSTQLRLLEKAFKQASIQSIFTREPGGTPGGELIRELLVKGDEAAWSAEAETLLFYAARIEHIEKLIRPALAAGKTVICDRFNDSTLVYQGYGKGLGEEFVQRLQALLIKDISPDVTFILDIDTQTGLERTGLRKDDETRFEKMHTDFHARVRKGFLDIAKKEPNRCVVIGAAQSEVKVHTAIIETLNKRFGLSLKPVAA